MPYREVRRDKNEQVLDPQLGAFGYECNTSDKDKGTRRAGHPGYHAPSCCFNSHANVVATATVHRPLLSSSSSFVVDAFVVFVCRRRLLPIVVGIVVVKAFVFLGRFVLLILQGGEELAAMCACEWITPVFTVLAFASVGLNATAFAFF